MSAHISELMMAPRSQNSTFSQQKSPAFHYTAYLHDKKATATPAHSRTTRRSYRITHCMWNWNVRRRQDEAASEHTEIKLSAIPHRSYFRLIGLRFQQDSLARYNVWKNFKFRGAFVMKRIPIRSNRTYKNVTPFPIWLSSVNLNPAFAYV